MVASYRYPAAVLNDLPSDRPMGIVILGKDLVVWKDSSGAWRIFEDKCPHRKVPLSEGRIETDGTLQCAYHGWRFAGDGACVKIPQAPNEDAEKQYLSAPRACATAYPTAEADGLLYVWMGGGPNAALESSQAAIKRDSDILDDATRVASPWVMREMHQSWEVLMENSTDPAHVSCAHHGIQGDRASPLKPNFKFVDRMECDTGFLVRTTAGPSLRNPENKVEQTMEVSPPFYRLRTYALGGDGRPEKRLMLLALYAVPITRNKTRMFARFDVEALAGTTAGKLARLRPAWHDHIERMRVLDGDAFLLARQTHSMRRGAVSHKQFYRPAPTDLTSVVLSQWLSRFSPDGVAIYNDVGDNDSATERLPREVVLDRYNQHTKHCKACSGMLRNTRISLRALAVLSGAAFLASAALLGQGCTFSAPMLLLAMGTMVVCAVSQLPLKKLEVEFVYTDYVHAER